MSAASATAVASTGSDHLARLDQSPISRSGVGTTISLRSTLGGVARSVGAEPSQPHLTAWRQAAVEDRVVLVHRRRRQPFVQPFPVGPGQAAPASACSAGRSRALGGSGVRSCGGSPRACAVAVSPLLRSSHLSRSSPTVAVVGSNLPSLTSATNFASATFAFASVPTNVFVTWRGLPVTRRCLRRRAAANARAEGPFAHRSGTWCPTGCGFGALRPCLRPSRA